MNVHQFIGHWVISVDPCYNSLVLIKNGSFNSIESGSDLKATNDYNNSCSKTNLRLSQKKV